MESLRGWVPVGAPGGTDTFTWYNPTLAGVKPLNSTVAELPPMVTLGAALVPASDVDEAGSPDDWAAVTGPSPFP